MQIHTLQSQETPKHLLGNTATTMSCGNLGSCQHSSRHSEGLEKAKVSLSLTTGLGARGRTQKQWGLSRMKEMGCPALMGRRLRL